MAYSTDGVTWRSVNSKFGEKNINGIAYGDGRFVAVGGRGSGSKGEMGMAYSADGESWTAVSDSKYGKSAINAIAYVNDRFIAVAGGKIAFVDTSDQTTTTQQSSSVMTWTAVANSTFDDAIFGIAYGNNKFVAGGRVGKISYSAYGITWTAVANSTIWQSTSRGSTYTADINDIAYGNNRFVAVGHPGKMAYSADGVSWTAVSNSRFGEYALINAIVYGNNRFVAVGGDSEEGGGKVG
jgi:hypothetical protein